MNKIIYLCDIDGTIADLSHRLHFIQSEPADWDGFFAACDKDSPIPDVICLIQHINMYADIVMVTGRSDAVSFQTAEWLRKHKVPFAAIYMRRAGDHRQDNIVKAELLEEILCVPDRPEILGVFEDRQQVVDMYREKGLRVYQVAAGKF